MSRRSMDFLARHIMTITGVMMVGVTVTYIWMQDYLSALGLLPFGVIFLMWPKVNNETFQSGWMAAALSYDEALRDLVDDGQRQLLFVASLMAMPTYADHAQDMLGRVAELEELLKRRGEFGD